MKVCISRFDLLFANRIFCIIIPENLPMTMAKDQESMEVQSTVQYKKFDNEDGVGESGDVTQRSSEHAPSSAATDRRQNGTMGQHPVVMMEPEVTDSSTANLPMHEVVLQVRGMPSTGGEPEEEPAWNWLNLVLSVASIFCCTVCGILATVTSILAYIDHKVRDFEGSRSKRVASYALALTALISGVICMVIVIVLAIHFDTQKH
jgi:hypothetical protein